MHRAPLSTHRGRDPAETVLRELEEKHHVTVTGFLVDRIRHFTALARTDLGSHQEAVSDVYHALYGFTRLGMAGSPVLSAGLPAYYNHY